MGTLAVRIDSGTSYHLLTSVASVADRRWCEVLDDAPSLASLLQKHGSRGLVADVRRPGRFGWLNLLTIAAADRGPKTTAGLLSAIHACDPRDLYLTMLGGRRRQLADLVTPGLLRDAAAGSRSARTDLRRVFASDDTILEATDWLLRQAPDQAQAQVLKVLEAVASVLFAGGEEARVRQVLRTEARERRAELGRTGDGALLGRLAPALTYAPSPAPDRVVLFPTPALAPVVVVVDEQRRTLIGYPPRAQTTTPDPSEVLVHGARALADPVRLQILDVLGEGPLTAQSLATAVGAPRTTLLHHLALMRAAGVIETSVGERHRTVYAVRAAGLEELADLVRDRVRNVTVEKSRH